MSPMCIPYVLLEILTSNPSCLGNQEFITFHSLCESTNLTSYKVASVATTLYTHVSPIDFPKQILEPAPNDKYAS